MGLVEINTSRINTLNYTEEVVDVQFLVIHYTAGLWEHAKFHFENGRVSTHFMIDVDGSIDEIVKTSLGSPFYAMHAGEGCYKIGNKIWKNYAFNKISLGIELVNVNGNVYKYTQDQYKSLAKLIRALKEKYPILEDSNRIIGHEQIAAYRGKADPGHKFNWNKCFSLSGYNEPYPKRAHYFPKKLLSQLQTKYEELYDNSLQRGDELSKYTEIITLEYFNNR